MIRFPLSASRLTQLLLISMTWGGALASAAPVISNPPQPVTVETRENAILSVAATGGTLSYQWYRGNSGDISSPVKDAVGSKLVMTPLLDSTSVWVRVTDETGFTDSSPAAVTVNPVYPSVLFTCGANTYKQLGNGQTTQATRPVEITQPVIEATGGDSHSLFIRADATLWGVGLNASGQVRDIADNVDNMVPNPVKIADDVVAVAARSNHSLFIKRDGSLWAMGDNNFYELGLGGGRRFGPVKIFEGVAQVATGERHTLVLKVDGTVWSMGSNTYGQLGVANASLPWSPFLVTTGVRQVAAGANHSFFLKMDDTLWAAGLNANGQLADGTLINRTTPVLVGQGVKRIAAGNSHSLVLSLNGAVSGAGANNYGQLGPVDASNKTAWTPIANPPVATAISAGADYSLCLRSTGALIATGRNQSGQLGRGNTAGTFNPVQVATGVVGVGAGSTHSLFTVARPYFTSQQLEAGAITGQTPALTVTAVGKQAVTYQWYVGESGVTTQPIENSNTNSYTTPPFAGNASYWVRVSSFGATADSQTLRVKSITPPVITAWPEDEMTAQGVSKTLEVTVTGEMLSYQWFRGEKGDTSNPIAGATSPVLTTPPILEDSSFWLRVTNVAGNVDSDAINITVAPAVLAAMGRSAEGQLGDGTVSAQPLPGVVATDAVGPGISKILSSSGLVMLLKDDGTLWSQDRYSSSSWLGAQRQPGQTGFIQVASDVAKVSVSWSYILILKTDGSLWGTGWNYYGILGNTGYQVSSLVQLETSVTDMIASDHHCLFVKNDGSLWAVGENFWGELGDGTTTDRTTPVKIATGVSKVAAESNESFFLKTDGTLWGMGFWTSDTRGDLPRQLADGITEITGSDENPLFLKADHSLWALRFYDSEPYQIASDVRQASSSGSHTLILKTDDTLWGRGRNYDGELGIGTFEKADAYVEIAGGVKFASASYGFSIFLKNDGSVHAMGSQAEMPFTPYPSWFRDRPYSLGGAVSQVAAGQAHSLFIKSDGTLWATGTNESGQIGDGVPGARVVPVQVAKDVIKVAAGDSHGLFIKTDATLWGMGSDIYGELGNSTQSTPVQISSDVREISAGSSFSLFIKTDGSLWGLGLNSAGQLGGDPDLSPGYHTTPVLLDTQVKRVAAGKEHTLFVKTDGTLWAMGNNWYGQCAGDTYPYRDNTPLHQVAAEVADVAAGRYHSLFVKRDGTLWGMGNNNSGQLGLGRNGDHETNVPVRITSGVSRVWGGDSFSLFLKTDGTLWGMGYGSQGQLGDAKNWTDLPVKIASGVIDASAGGGHTLFTSIAPVISSQPVSVTVAAGGTAVFSVDAFGYGPLAYQWFRGASGDTSQPVAGATETQLTASVTTRAAEYWVRVSNTVSHEDSRSVTVAITGQGSIGYQTWAASEGLADISPDADPDQDGMSNLMEYALNTDPREAAAGQAPMAGIINWHGIPSLEMTLRQRRDPDVTIRYEWSADLKTWSTSGPVYEVIQSDVDGDSSTEQIRVTIPLESAGKGFLRVRVTDP